jgi:energy-coupling factor transport system ATP-binding protein
MGVSAMIEIKNLSFKYGKDDDYILKNINLSVRKGECILLCGKSGCGKSTLLKTINGIIPEFCNGEIDGSVKVCDMNTFETELYKISEKVGSVFQNPKTQFYTTNTTDEIAFGLENYGLERAKINKKIEEVKNTFNLVSLMNRNIFELSGGEKQKIAIASVYALNPDILVFDEPSSSLDIDSMRELSKIIEKLKAVGKTIIIAEHRLWYLKNVVDRAIYLENGEITKEYSMEEIQNLTEEERLKTGLRHTEFQAGNFKRKANTLKNATELEIDGLLYKRKKKTILQIDNLNFESGKIIGIIGKNGMGKSTFARIVCGLEKQSSGRICKCDRQLSSKNRITNSLLVMQEVNNQLFTDTVYDEINLTSDTDDEKINICMENMQIDNLKQRNPHTLSGGQKQRVVILSALLSNKPFLFFDEPTSGLDYASMKVVAENIKNFKEEKKLILIISHDYEFLEEVCDEVIHFS